jgi:hypothetical protein
MASDDDDPDLDRRIARLRRRGRPPMGFTKAMQYSDEYWELLRAGFSSWHAKVEVARRNRKRPEHISACVKLINETDPHEYMYDEPDYSEDPTCGGRWVNDGESEPPTE